MWLEDFQKSLIILNYVKKGIRFNKRYCSPSCNFMNYSGNYCRLFIDVLHIKIGSGERKSRLTKCIDLFGMNGKNNE